jgi:hypothetical protein
MQPLFFHISVSMANEICVPPSWFFMVGQLPGEWHSIFTYARFTYINNIEAGLYYIGSPVKYHHAKEDK